MAEGPAAPDDPRYLLHLLARSPLLPESGLRRHWQRLVVWLSPAERYALAGILLEVERALAHDPAWPAGRARSRPPLDTD